jgi:putative tryptophan/tyrosine transport system ATP-binding protein
MPDIALRLEGVSQVFHPDTPNEVRALDHIDLELERGTFTVVLGTNGSGKSSLLNAIAGSLALAGGRVYLDGQEVTRWTEQRRARLISRVFQNPFTGTASDLTVAENLVLAARRGGQRWLRQGLGRDRRKAMRERVAELGMGLEDRLDTPIGLLSGGQRQALTVLMATLVRPSLLMLDEHTAALDPRSAEQVSRLTQGAIALGGLTTLMVTHSMTQAVQLGDRVLVMHRGRVVYDFGDVRRGRLAEDDLLQLFDQLRWADRLDDSAAEMLRRAYV